MNKNIEKIDSIKNISFIYFYNVYENTDTLGLKVVLDGSTVLSCDYRNENFYEFVDKVIEIYMLEKNQHNIIINDFSKQMIEKLSKREKNKKSYTQEYGIIEFNRLHFKIKLIEEYIVNTLKNILSSIFFEDKEIIVENFKGYKNKFVLKYKVTDDCEERFVPLIIKHDRENIYSFEASIFVENLLKINGKIEFLNNSINIMWSNFDKSIIGRNINHIDSINDTNVIKFGDSNGEKFICFDNNDKTIDNNEKDLIDNVLTQFNYPSFDSFKNIRKILNNYFIAYSHFNDLSNNKGYFKDDYYHIILKSDILKLSIYNIEGYLKENDFKLITNNSYHEILAQPLMFSDKKYLLTQITNIENEFPHYHYDLYSLNDDFTSFNTKFKIEEKKSIDENIESIEDIKKLILK